MCPECGKDIDIENISMDYRKMKKDSLWAQCPLCEKYILPKLIVKLGNDVNCSKSQEGTKTTRFILHSPYELKVNLKESIDKNLYQFLDVDQFKMKYPSLFWSCIWYFRLNKIDYDIMLPYEYNIVKLIIHSNYYKTNINSIINNNAIKEKASNKNKNNIKKKSKKRKYRGIMIIQDVHSFYYINNKFYKYHLGDLKTNNSNNYDMIRKKTYNFKKYLSIESFYKSLEQSSNKKKEEEKEKIEEKKEEKKIDNEKWKRMTLKEKQNLKYFEN
jgi:hypothetical protein